MLQKLDRKELELRLEIIQKANPPHQPWGIGSRKNDFLDAVEALLAIPSTDTAPYAVLVPDECFPGEPYLWVSPEQAANITDHPLPNPASVPEAEDLSSYGAQLLEENGRKVLSYWPYCNECRKPFEFEKEEPFASCGCPGSTEWGDPRPASWVQSPTPNARLEAASLTDEAMQQLPKGRHALVIAGAYGIDGYVAAPQPSPTTKPAPQQAAPGEREQAAQRLRELAGISQEDVTDPLHPRYIEGYKAGHAAGRKRAAPQQEAQEPCPTCAALARTVMLDQVSFDRKPDCYGIRQITDDEGVEEWEDIRTSPDVAREEANDMMATGRGEIYEVVPLWTTPQLAPLSDDVVKDAALWHWLAEYLVGTRTDLDDEIVACETVNDLRKLVEAAIKQGATQ